MTIDEIAIRVGRVEAIDGIAEPVAKAAKKLVPRGPIKDALSGTWLGHQLHPLLTDIPIGSFTSATILDLIGGRRAQPAANLLAAVGVLSTVPTAAAGLVDWSDTSGAPRRIGVVHAAANIVGIGFYTASVVARRRGRRASATGLGLLGMGVMSVGGLLGGHLTLVRGVGVNHTLLEDPSSDWVPALAEAELGDNKPKRVEVDDISILLTRRDGVIDALSNRCTHAGGPLDEGTFDGSGADACVTCPWHQSTFRLRDGAVVHGPASVAQPSYESRVRDGTIELQPR
jgi:nitrite reductase/ring-hydroxylating ferredoxin subunit/uncharacterized membrane protein